MALFITSIIVALGVSFLCSLMEAAVLSLTPSQVAQLAARCPRLGAICQDFKANIERPIAVILVLNTAGRTIGALVAGAQFDALYGGQWIWIFSLGFTYLILQFTEILPKTLGVRFNRELASWIARPLAVAVRVLTPLLKLIHWVNRPFEVRRDPCAPPATLEEISALAGLARLSKQLNPQLERVIVSATTLADLCVEQVMLPREQISFLSTSQTIYDALIIAHMDVHTRFPVCEANDPDRVVGYVNFKEMVYFMRTNPGDPSLRGIIRPVHFVTPQDSASNLLRVFVNEHVHMAIVRDEAGRTLGLITLEDLVEELVGELEDEFDHLPRMFHPLSGNTWMIGGGLPVTELARRLRAPLSDQQGTVSSWLRRHLERSPKVGDEYQEAGLKLVVRRLRRGNVFEAAVHCISRIQYPVPGPPPQEPSPMPEPKLLFHEQGGDSQCPASEEQHT